MDRATHDKIHFDLDLDSALPNEQLGLAGVRSVWRMGLEALLLQSHNGLVDSIADALECRLAWQCVVGKH